MAKAINLQDMFLNQCRKEGISVTVYLIGGVQLRGLVRGFDPFTLLLDSPGKPTQLVYKHAITSIVPSRTISGYRPAYETAEGRQPEEQPTEGEQE
jgi:host factor-I protein